MEIIGRNPFDRVLGFMLLHGANKKEMTDVYHLALWIEGAPTDVKDMFLETFNENDWPELRICDTCGCFMNEGYLLGGMMEHYCSRECAVKSYIKDALKFAYEEITYEEAERRLDHDLDFNADDCFWTEWR